MRRIRIYQPGNYAIGDSVVLAEEAAHHVGVVLRQRIGDQLTLFSGDNRECEAEIIQMHKKAIQVRICQEAYIDKESPLQIILAQAICKGERMEWIVQKAVELGVTAFFPIITQHGSYKLAKENLQKKHHQWQAIAVSACEQCGRNRVPQIAEPTDLLSFLSREELAASPQKFLLDPYEGQSWKSYQQLNKQVVILVGPEGGFSAAELQSASQADFLPLYLGPRILRTETAAISAVSLFQAAWGDIA